MQVEDSLIHVAHRIAVIVRLGSSKDGKGCGGRMMIITMRISMVSVVALASTFQLPLHVFVL